MDFQDAYNRVVGRIKGRYRVDVCVADVLDPNTGDLDGSRILIDHDQDLETALFVLLHLFGHTVQWNTSEEYRRIGLATTAASEGELASIYAYEREATCYSLSLLHEAGVTDLDQWISDWWRADWEYLRHFYETGERLDVRALLKRGAGDILTPLPIPGFVPQRWTSRFSF